MRENGVLGSEERRSRNARARLYFHANLGLFFASNVRRDWAGKDRMLESLEFVGGSVLFCNDILISKKMANLEIRYRKDKV